MSRLFGIAVLTLAVTGVAQAQYPAQVGYPGPYAGGDIPWSESYGSGPQGLDYSAWNSNGGGEQLYPYDQQDPWQHGYFQEIPAYGGYSHFRPYNYKHVLSQTQAAAGWGLSRTMPYSHQFWARYHERASLQHCPLPYHAYDQYKADPVGYRVPENTPTALRPNPQR